MTDLDIDESIDELIRLRAEVERYRAIVEDLVMAYTWCTEDISERGWAVMDDTVEDARAELEKYKT